MGSQRLHEGMRMNRMRRARRIMGAIESFKVFGAGGASTGAECFEWAKCVGLPEVPVPLTALPPWAREVFNVPKLNRVQSKAFPIAFGTDEPILLCAPTGSGKVGIYQFFITNIYTFLSEVALLTILNELAKHRNEETGEFD
jgi:hypothetical protein